MNTLEDRLREALGERASLSSIDPDAWDKTVARSRRRFRPARFRPARFPRGTVSLRTVSLRLGIPAAAAAAVVAIALVATALTGSHDLAGGTRTSTGPAPVGSARSQQPPAPPGRNSSEIQSNPPVTAIVRVAGIGGPGTWTFLWFGYTKGDRAEGIELCSVTDGGDYFGGGLCAPVSLQAQQGFVEGIGPVKIGVASKHATSVTATLPAGRTVKGVVVSGSNFPDSVWLVNYPTADSVGIVARDAAGHPVAHSIIMGELPTPSRPHSGGIVIFRYHGDPTTAYLIDGKFTVWEDGGTSSSSKTIWQIPLAILSAMYNQEDNPQINFGYAPSDVARVALQLPDGRELSADTIPGWAGSGVRLWGPIIMPAHVFLGLTTKILTYNAAGHLLSEVPLSKLYG
jgi:hypothetical protein